MPWLFSSNSEGRHKPTLKDWAVKKLDKINAFRNARDEQGKLENDQKNREWHERDRRDRKLDAGRHSDYGNVSHQDSQSDQEDRRRQQQILDEEDQRLQQQLADERERIREDDRLQREIDRQREVW